MREWSTFADGKDCRECECLEAENDKLRAELDETNRHYNLAQGLLRKSIATEDMQSLTISKLRADLEVAKEVLCALIESIETPARLGLATINKDWEALNAAREALAKLGDKPEGE